MLRGIRLGQPLEQPASNGLSTLNTSPSSTKSQHGAQKIHRLHTTTGKKEVATRKKEIATRKQVATGKKEVVIEKNDVTTGKKEVISGKKDATTGKKEVISGMKEGAGAGSGGAQKRPLTWLRTNNPLASDISVSSTKAQLGGQKIRGQLASGKREAVTGAGFVGVSVRSAMRKAPDCRSSDRSSDNPCGTRIPLGRQPARSKSRARVGVVDNKTPSGYVPKQSNVSTRRQDADPQSAPAAQTPGKRHTPPNRQFKAVSTHNLSVFDRLSAPTAASLARSKLQNSSSWSESRLGGGCDQRATANQRTPRPITPAAARREPLIYAPEPRTPQTQLEAWEQRGFAAYEAARIIEKRCTTNAQKERIRDLHRHINAVFVAMKIRASEKEAKVEAGFRQVVAQLKLIFFVIEEQPEENQVTKLVSRIAGGNQKV